MGFLFPTNETTVSYKKVKGYLRVTQQKRICKDYKKTNVLNTNNTFTFVFSL